MLDMRQPTPPMFTNSYPANTDMFSGPDARMLHRVFGVVALGPKMGTPGFNQSRERRLEIGSSSMNRRALVTKSPGE